MLLYLKPIITTVGIMQQPFERTSRAEPVIGGQWVEPAGLTSWSLTLELSADRLEVGGQTPQ